MICSACQAWIEPIIDTVSSTETCPECGDTNAFTTFPIFIITGTSGAGKTAILPDLRRLLSTWDIFETDILRDSSGNWDSVWNNWLRIAAGLSESRRPVILSGTVLPDTLDGCDDRYRFAPVHYVALHCDDAAREDRLRARPAWRGWTDERIEKQRKFAQWLLDHAKTDFEPPLRIVDTSGASVAETAKQVRDWATDNWSTWSERHTQ
jgi:broad-specificity NMP kinase